MAQVKAKMPRKKASPRQKKDWIAAYIFIAPVTLGLLVFYIWPFIQNIWFSFNDVNKFNMSTFVGLENYKELMGDKEVWRALGTTLKYVIVTVPVGIFLSTFLAALLNAKIRGKSIYRTLYFLPSVTMSAAVAMVWKWMYNEKMGILNSAIKSMGGTGHNWLTDSHTALYMIMVVGLWMTVGYNMIILLAGMQGISKTYYEAAQIDGANFWQRLKSITLPMLTGSIMINLVFGITYGLKVFDIIYVLTNGGPGHATEVVTTYSYQMYADGAYGMSTAFNTILLILTAIAGIFVVKNMSKKEVQQ